MMFAAVEADISDTFFILCIVKNNPCLGITVVRNSQTAAYWHKFTDYPYHV